MLVAKWLLGLLVGQLAALPMALPHLQRVELNARVLVFNAILCLLLTALCGLAPILLAVRTDLQFVFRAGRAATASRGSSRLFSSLIALQAGFALLLLVGSGLMIRSLVRLQSEDRGFRPSHVLTLRVPAGTFLQARPTGKYDSRPRQIAYYREILEKVRTVPGIRAAAIVNNLPLSGVNTSLNFRFTNAREPELTSARTVSSQYFTAMGIPLVAGRDFQDGDVAGSPGVAILNEYLARQLFPDRNPIGEKLIGESKESGPTVVGVVRDTPQNNYELPAKGEIYIPYQQFIFATFLSTIVVRTEGEPTALAAALRHKVWEVDPNQPVVKVETLEEVISNSIWRPRFSAWIFSVLSGLCVLLTALGVYGVVAYTSTLRARELGIRVALGASPKEVIAVILRGTLLPLGIGICVSVAAALALSRLLTNLLYGTSHTDPLTYAAAVTLLLTIGVAASIRPAWRAATMDPVRTLRTE